MHEGRGVHSIPVWTPAIFSLPEHVVNSTSWTCSTTTNSEAITLTIL